MKIKPPKIKEWRTVNTENDLRAALADVTATSFGNVGQHIGYRITDKARKDMKNWDFDDRMNARHLIDHPYSRIDSGSLSRKDLGNFDVTITPISGKVWINDRWENVSDSPSENKASWTNTYTHAAMKRQNGPVRFAIFLVLLGFAWPVGLALLSNLGIMAGVGVMCYPSIALMLVAGMVGMIGGIR